MNIQIIGNICHVCCVTRDRGRMTGVTVVTIFSPIITPSLIPECYKNPDMLPDNSYLGPPSLETWAGEEYLVPGLLQLQGDTCSDDGCRCLGNCHYSNSNYELSLVFKMIKQLIQRQTDGKFWTLAAEILTNN